MMGKGSVSHNTRAFSAKNVDKERTILICYFVPIGTAFVTFCESNAKALSTRSALSKVPLRPAGSKLSIGQHTVLTDGAAFRRLDTAAFRLSPNSATLQCL